MPILKRHFCFKNAWDKEICFCLSANQFSVDIKAPFVVFLKIVLARQKKSAAVSNGLSVKNMLCLVSECVNLDTIFIPLMFSSLEE